MKLPLSRLLMCVDRGEDFDPGQLFYLEEGGAIWVTNGHWLARSDKKPMRQDRHLPPGAVLSIVEQCNRKRPIGMMSNYICEHGNLCTVFVDDTGPIVIDGHYEWVADGLQTYRVTLPTFGSDYRFAGLLESCKDAIAAYDGDELVSVVMARSPR